MWSVKRRGLYSSHFITLRNWNLRSFVHCLFLLSLHLSCLVKSVWGTLGIFCECAPHMCDMVPQVEDWGLDQDTQPSPCVCRQTRRNTHYFGHLLLSLGRECVSTVQAEGRGLVCPGHGYRPRLLSVCLMSPTPGPWLSRFVSTVQNII